MKHRVFLAFGTIVLVSAFPLLAQMPKGWMVHGDHSTNAADPDAPGDAKLMVMGSGLHIVSPQAGVYWTPADTATGNYALKGTFKLIKTTGYNEYYGLVFGGSYDSLKAPNRPIFIFHDHRRRNLAGEAPDGQLNRHHHGQNTKCRHQEARWHRNVHECAGSARNGE